MEQAGDNRRVEQAGDNRRVEQAGDNRREQHETFVPIEHVELA